MEHALLPGVDEVLVAQVPWAGYDPPAPDAAALADLVERVCERAYDEVVVFTGFHQSPLPVAVLARLAGVPLVAGTSEDHPGTLLDVRHRRPATPEGGGGDGEQEQGRDQQEAAQPPTGIGVPSDHLSPPPSIPAAPRPRSPSPAAAGSTCATESSTDDRRSRAERLLQVAHEI